MRRTLWNAIYSVFLLPGNCIRSGASSGSIGIFLTRRVQTGAGHHAGIPWISPGPGGGNGHMTLVMAFVGREGAVMAADMREITFIGDRESVERLEGELYDGRIVTDGELKGRALELGVILSIRDDKVKAREREGVLV